MLLVTSRLAMAATAGLRARRTLAPPAPTPGAGAAAPGRLAARAVGPARSTAYAYGGASLHRRSAPRVVAAGDGAFELWSTRADVRRADRHRWRSRRRRRRRCRRHDHRLSAGSTTSWVSVGTHPTARSRKASTTGRLPQRRHPADAPRRAGQVAVPAGLPVEPLHPRLGHGRPGRLGGQPIFEDCGTPAAARARHATT